MGKELVIIVSLPTENDTLYLIDDSFALVPPVQAFDEITAHNEVEGVRACVFLFELIEEEDGGDVFPMFNLDRVHLNGETRWKEILNCQPYHVQAMLRAGQVLLVWTRSARNKPDFIELEQVNRF